MKSWHITGLKKPCFPLGIFFEFENQFHLGVAYLTDVEKSYKTGFKLSIDIPLLGVKELESREVDQIVNDDKSYPDVFYE